MSGEGRRVVLLDADEWEAQLGRLAGKQAAGRAAAVCALCVSVLALGVSLLEAWAWLERLLRVLERVG